MDVMEAIRTRASIRKFKPDPIGDDVVNTLLEAVRRCQSWSNTQCWELVLVKEPSIKEQLRETIGKANPSSKGWMDAPIIAAFCARKGISGCYQGKAITDKGDWFMFDMGMAVENFCLAAHALGLGTVTVGFFDTGAAGKILGLPEGYTVVSMNPVGYPDQPYRSPKRKEISSFIHYDHF